MITKKQYLALKKQHEIACENGDYSKMIMLGDPNHKKMKEYERKYICKHTRIIEEQGGQIERCLDCGETWG